MKGFGNIMKEAQKLQQQMEALQAEVAKKKVDATAKKLDEFLALAYAEWMDTKLNFIDAPGYLDFLGEATTALHTADAAVIVLSGVSGVEVGTEKVWEICDHLHLPRIIFVSQMDKERADFERVFDDVKAHLSPKVVPVEIPVRFDSVSDTRMASTISAGGDPGAPRVQTIEHLMSACCGLGIDNAIGQAPILAAAPSQELTAKYGSQCGGTPFHSSPSITFIPPTGCSPTARRP